MFAIDFYDEYALAAKISEAEALEPQTLKEVRSCPNWPLWEKAINKELATLKSKKNQPRHGS